MRLNIVLNMRTFSKYIDKYTNEGANINLRSKIREFANKSIAFDFRKEEDCIEFLVYLNEFMIKNGFANDAEYAFVNWAMDVYGDDENKLKRLYNRGVDKLISDTRSLSKLTLGDVIDICELIKPKDVVETFLLSLK